jgi:hypothetical protein
MKAQIAKEEEQLRKVLEANKIYETREKQEEKKEKKKEEELSKKVVEEKRRRINKESGKGRREEETTSSLHAFVGTNSIIVSELGAALDSCKVHVSLLEEQLKQQKDQMEVSFVQQMKQKEYSHSIEVDNLKNMHAQEVENPKAEYREQFNLSKQHKHKILELEHKLQKMENAMKENN